MCWASQNVRSAKKSTSRRCSSGRPTNPLGQVDWTAPNRSQSNGDEVNRIAKLALAQKPSVHFSGYPN
jgi:hypothetical protein